MSFFSNRLRSKTYRADSSLYDAVSLLRAGSSKLLMGSSAFSSAQSSAIDPPLSSKPNGTASAAGYQHDGFDKGVEAFKAMPGCEEKRERSG